MYNILIFGTGKTKDQVESGLNDNVNVIAYLDNDTAKWGNKINGKYVLEPEKIKNIDYDYVIIASQFNDSIYDQLIGFNVPPNKIFQNSIFGMFNFNYIKNELVWAIKNKFEYDICITGISYTKKGLSEQKLKFKALNLSTFSQDLFYDYNLCKYVINNDEIKTPKYVIIGLSYYSFEYDLSLSSMKYRSFLYYDAIGVLHNFLKIDDLNKTKKLTLDIAHKLYKFNDDGVEIDWMLNNDKLYALDEEKGRIQAKKDCNKNYPETVKENIKIFDDYLDMLHKNNIKPIIVVFPASKYYTKYFDDRIKKQFKNIIEVRKNKFQYIDYFESDKFTDEDFFDVSHLNPKGAAKFTEILNNEIEW